MDRVPEKGQDTGKRHLAGRWREEWRLSSPPELFIVLLTCIRELTQINYYRGFRRESAVVWLLQGVFNEIGFRREYIRELLYPVRANIHCKDLAW
ncbi:hypothetical protein TNCV_302621 [Trichonephila clavipes]|nr:hypothetical protein TNCV_302621 [Trichonephila clavipes]